MSEMSLLQRAHQYSEKIAHIDSIMQGRAMAELSPEEQRDVFSICVECMAMQMGASADSVVHHKPLKVDIGVPFDCEHFANGEWRKVTIARDTYDRYRPVGEYPHKMEAFFANLCNPAEFRNFIYR